MPLTEKAQWFWMFFSFKNILDKSQNDLTKGFSLKPKIVLTGYLHSGNRFLYDKINLREQTGLTGERENSSRRHE